MWLAFLNDSGETIPPFAAVEPSGIDASTGLVKVDKPSGAAVNVWFNGGAAVSPDESGQLTTILPARAAYAADNDDGADPVHGETWGVQEDSWYLHRDVAGFQVIGDGSKGLCNVIAESVAAQAERAIADVTPGDLWNGVYVDHTDSPYTAADGDRVYADASGGDVTIYLPYEPPAGQMVRVILANNPTGVYGVTVDGNGTNVYGGTSITLDSTRGGYVYKFTSTINEDDTPTDQGWCITGTQPL